MFLVRWQSLFWLLLIIVEFSLVKSYAQEMSDKANAQARAKAHSYLFDEYVNEKKCVFSQDNKQLLEVFIFEGAKEVTNAVQIALPKGTRLVAPMFNQLVVWGDNLKGLKAEVVDKHGNCKFFTDREMLNQPEALSITRNQRLGEPRYFKYLRRSFEDNNSSVFRLLGAVPRTEDDQPLFLKLTSVNKITVTGVFLRRRGDTILRDFAKHQHNVQVFDFEDSELDKQFLLSTVSRDFDELAESLDENSEAFDRIVMPAQMGADIEYHPVKGMLADRRIAKLYEGLSRMDPGCRANGQRDVR